jgi:MFS family permease
MNQDKKSSFISAAIVMALESYDFTVFLLLVRGTHFLFTPTKLQGPLFVFDILIGLLARPLGGLILARLSDKYGRKPLLILVTYLMSSFTLFFAMIPTSGNLMQFMPYFLVVFRALQGMVFGSSIVITNSYFAEVSPQSKRGFFTSFTAVCQEIGALVAILVSIGFYAMPSSDYMIKYGWRIPFISGALSILIGLHLRYGMMESPIYKKSFAKLEPLKILFKGYLSHIVKLFLLVPIFSICFYLFRVFILNQSQNVQALSVSEILIVSLTACIVSMCTSLLGGYLSDLVGRKPVLIASSIGIFLLTWPLLTMINHEGTEAMVFARMLVAQIMIALFSGLYAGAFAPLVVELFPPEARATAVGLTYNLSVSLIAGGSPLSSLFAFYGDGTASLPAYYLTFWAIIAIVVVSFFVKETHKNKLIDS